MSKKTLAVSLVALVLAGLSLTGCKATAQFQDAPVTNRYKQPVEVYDNADGFSNVSEFCDKHGNRIIVAFHGDSAYSAITAIPNDPSCAG